MTHEKVKEKAIEKKAAMKKQILAAYTKCGASVSATCKAVGVSRLTFYRYRKEDKDFDEQLKENEEELKDYVESQLMSLIHNNDKTAIIFFLKTKCKDRGYCEHYEVSQSINHLPVVQVKLPEKI